MNFIAIGSAALLALVVIGLLLFKQRGLHPIWRSASAKQKAAEDQRRDQILRG